MEPLTAAAIMGGTALIGGMMNDKSAEKAAKRNAQQQERFAREGIQWKVQDAKKAGIAPEFALGASTQSFQPTDTGSQSGNLVADAGQNIARAALASGTKEDRAMDSQLKAQTLRGMTLDNDLKATQLTSVNRPGNPAFPHPRGNVIPGQGDSPVVDVPLQRTGQSAGARHSEGGSIPMVGWAENQKGGLMPVPSADVKNRIEDQLIPESVWAFENLVKPNFGGGSTPPKSALPKGFDYWKFSRADQAYYPAKGKASDDFDAMLKALGVPKSRSFEGSWLDKAIKYRNKNMRRYYDATQR